MFPAATRAGDCNASGRDRHACYNSAMTAEERQRMEDWIRQHCGPHQYGEQDDNGVDLSLIRSNLRLSPLDRVRKGDEATSGALRLRKHAKRH